MSVREIRLFGDPILKTKTAPIKDLAKAKSLVEDLLRAHPLVGQVVVIGDQKPFIAALVSLDPEMVPIWSANNGITEKMTLAEATKHPAILAELQSAVELVNEKFSQSEQIRKFELLDVELTEASGHLTPSLKIKRNKVMTDFAIHVDRIYA